MALERNDPLPGGSDGDAGLDLFFAAARGPEGRPGPLPAPLMQRILADAAAVAAPHEIAEVMTARPGIFRAVWTALGGWPAMAGMATATLAGVWLGFAQPAVMSDMLSFGTDYTMSDFMASVDLAEGS